MKRYLKLYWLFIKYSVVRAMMYKEDFIIWSLVSIGWMILMLVFYQLLFLNVDSIAGWTKPQVLLIQGFYFMLELVLWGALWENMRGIPEKINKGTMDIELIKPINHQFLLSFKDFSFDNMPNFILGLFTVIYALNLGQITPTPMGISLSILAFIIASIYIYSGWFTTMCIAFWFDRFDNLHYFFPGLRQFWKVPHPFYKGVLRGIFTFVLPVTLVTTVPVEFLLGRPQWTWFAILTFFAIATLKFSSWFFNFAIKHYSSASS